jgi:hypothetical protein
VVDARLKISCWWWFHHICKSKLKRSLPSLITHAFLAFLLIHLFGVFAREISWVVNPSFGCVSKDRRKLDPQVFSYGIPQMSELSTQPQSQAYFSICTFFLSNPKSIVAPSEPSSILSLVSHISYPRNLLHMHGPQLSTSRIETQDNSWKAKNIGYVDHSTKRSSDLMEGPLVPKVNQQSHITFLGEPLESSWHQAECLPKYIPRG